MWQLRVKEKAPVSPKRRKLPSAVPLLLISISSLHISPKGECTSLITARNPVPPTTRRFSADCSRASKSSVRIPSHSTRRLSEMLAATFSLSLHLNSYDCGNHTQFPPPCQGKRRTFLGEGDPPAEGFRIRPPKRRRADKNRPGAVSSPFCNLPQQLSSARLRMVVLHNLTHIFFTPSVHILNPRIFSLLFRLKTPTSNNFTKTFICNYFVFNIIFRSLSKLFNHIMHRPPPSSQPPFQTRFYFLHHYKQIYALFFNFYVQLVHTVPFIPLQCFPAV